MKGSPAGDGLAVALPSSLTAETREAKAKTLKVGYVARAAAIYRVDEVFVYTDPRHDDADLIEKVLRYAECPPYLRRRLFPRQEELKYVGAIPPLQTPNHAVSREPVEGEYREGVVLERGDVGGGAAWVDVGLDSPALLLGGNPGAGRRITVETISRGEPVEVAQVEPGEVPHYWGYSVASGPLEELGRRYRERGLELVGTSREGRDVRRADLPKGAAVVFGSPLGGIRELPLQVEQVINTVPEQGTLTIRTEEAIHASLAVLNLGRAPMQEDP